MTQDRNAFVLLLVQQRRGKHPSYTTTLTVPYRVAGRVRQLISLSPKWLFVNGHYDVHTVALAGEVKKGITLEFLRSDI
jgi:hypothetical protein